MQSIYFQLINFILPMLHSNTSLYFSLDWLKLVWVYSVRVLHSLLSGTSLVRRVRLSPAAPALTPSICCASLEGSAHSPPARLGRNLPWKQFHRKTCISWLKENLPQNNLTHTSGNTSASRITQFLHESLFIFYLALFPT